MGGTVDAYRLKQEFQARVAELLDTVRTFLGRRYDFRFQLDDRKVYCSELIYTCFKKAYADTLGRLVRLGDLDWQPYERSIRRLERGPVPLDRLIISPQALSEAAQLDLVYRGIRSSDGSP